MNLATESGLIRKQGTISGKTAAYSCINRRIESRRRVLASSRSRAPKTPIRTPGGNGRPLTSSAGTRSVMIDRISRSLSLNRATLALCPRPSKWLMPPDSKRSASATARNPRSNHSGLSSAGIEPSRISSARCSNPPRRIVLTSRTTLCHLARWMKPGESFAHAGCDSDHACTKSRCANHRANEVLDASTEPTNSVHNPQTSMSVETAPC